MTVTATFSVASMFPARGRRVPGLGSEVLNLFAHPLHEKTPLNLDVLALDDLSEIRAQITTSLNFAQLVDDVLSIAPRSTNKRVSRSYQSQLVFVSGSRSLNALPKRSL